MCHCLGLDPRNKDYQCFSLCLSKELVAIRLLLPNVRECFMVYMLVVAAPP